MFHLQQSRRHKFSMVLQFLSRLQRISSRWFLLLDQEKTSFSFNLFTTYPKKNITARIIMLTSISSIAFVRVKINRLDKFTKFPILYILIPSRSSSTITTLSERLSYSSMKMNVSLSAKKVSYILFYFIWYTYLIFQLCRKVCKQSFDMWLVSIK